MEFGTKKLEKTWNLAPKTLRKPGIWYLEKSGNHDIEAGINLYSFLSVQLRDMWSVLCKF